MNIVEINEKHLGQILNIGNKFSYNYLAWLKTKTNPQTEKQDIVC